MSSRFPAIRLDAPTLCRSADARMRTQNTLLLTAISVNHHRNKAPGVSNKIELLACDVLFVTPSLAAIVCWRVLGGA